MKTLQDRTRTKIQIAVAAILAAASQAALADASDAPDASGPPSEVVVTAQKLNEARSSIETQTGASTYTIDSQAIAAMPGGTNNQLNQVLLQAPDVVQDSFGQLHVRADHNDLQYRINGIILPEGISVFSQSLSPWLISSLKLITGALPAEYGLRTAGIIDLTTNSGGLQPGGQVSLYGGSHSTFQPSAEFGGSSGQYTYYVSADYKQSDLGIDSPDGRSTPLHDHTTQGHAFAYLEDILDSSNRLSLILGTSNEEFEIPNAPGQQPSLGLQVLGQTLFPSDNLNERQHELTQYAVLTWQHSDGPLDVQNSLSVRYTSLHFAPDIVPDLLYNSIAQDAFKKDTAVGWQTDAAYKLNEAHTLRAGLYYQHDSSTSNTTSYVLPVDDTGVQTSDIPLAVGDNSTASQQIESVYLQDEWKIFSPLTVNYGLRFDHYSAYSSGSQVSPRVNAVLELGSGTTIHGGYSRYYTPPPFELIGSGTFTKLAGTTAVPPGTNTQNTPPLAEKSNYYDLGIQQTLFDKQLTLGLDGFYKQAQHLIDEGQFGAPIILTPFNYRYGILGGVEFTVNYTVQNFSAYFNSAWQAAHGKGVESAQFNFGPDDLDYISKNYIHLDHEGRVSASGGVSYLWQGTRISVDGIFGSGLRSDETLDDGSTIPNGGHLPSYLQVNLGLSHTFEMQGAGALTARLDVINVADKVYEIRDSTGIGVFASQFGPRRGVFGGVAWKF